jgi:hypothetical protein
MGSPTPSCHSSAVAGSPRASSTLFAASSTGLRDRCRTRATAASSSVTPTVASTTSTTASAAATASSACSAMRPAIPRASRCQPPVSSTVNRRPFHDAS